MVTFTVRGNDPRFRGFGFWGSGPLMPGLDFQVAVTYQALDLHIMEISKHDYSCMGGLRTRTKILLSTSEPEFAEKLASHQAYAHVADLLL